MLIDPNRIEANPFFSRRNLEASLDKSFIESVTRNLMQPIIVRPKPDERYTYQVACGHRRWTAFRKKNMMIPATVRNLSDEEMVDCAFVDAFQYEEHQPEEETKLILTKLDFKLRRTADYQRFGCDPLAVLRALDSERHIDGFPPRGGKKRPRGRPRRSTKIPSSIVNAVQSVFAELPESRRMHWTTFLRHRVPLLELADDVRDSLDRREVRGSSRAKEAVARVQDELARKMMIDWACSKKRVSVRVLDKRAYVLNRCADTLALIRNPAERQRIITLVLERCPHPRDIQLEVEKLAPWGPSKFSRPMNNLEDVYVGRDSRYMSEIADESVRLIVTSPPFFNKIEFDDYLSRCKTPDEYFSKIEPILAECHRVLVPAGKLCIDWGEPTEDILAYRWVEICGRIGFKLQARFIWHKYPPAYAIARRRVRFSDAVHTDGKAHLNWEWILVFRKTGATPETRSELSHEEFVKLTDAVWRISPACEGPRSLAVFPNELVERLVRYYSFPGDLVLDPFLGTGTTVKVARKLGRRGAGYEIASWLLPVIQKTLATE